MIFFVCIALLCGACFLPLQERHQADRNIRTAAPAGIQALESRCCRALPRLVAARRRYSRLECCCCVLCAEVVTRDNGCHVPSHHVIAVTSVQQYAPWLRAEHVERSPHHSGVRAQAVAPDGSLVEDFRFEVIKPNGVGANSAGLCILALI